MGEEACKYSFHFYDPSCGQEGQTWSGEMIDGGVVCWLRRGDYLTGETGEVVVCLLCGDDGREAVSKVAKKVCSSVQGRRSCLEEFTVSDLDRQMPLGGYCAVDFLLFCVCLVCAEGVVI